MKALVNTASERLEFRDVPLPEPGPGQVRIRTAVCGICATDFEMIDGCARSRFPQILGHEWSGVVEKCGHAVGQSILGRPCVAENILADGGEVGFEHPGGYGEFFVTEAANVHLLPDGFPMEEAALVEPLTVTIRGIRRLRPAKGTALVIGDGTIGLLFLLLLKHHGVEQVTLIGGRETRLRLASEFGASTVIDYHKVQGSMAEAISRSFTGKFDSIVDATKSVDALSLVCQLGAPEAKVLLIGNYYEKKAELSLQHVLLNEFEIIGSNSGAKAWPDAVKLAVGHELPLGKFATHRFPVADFATAMQTARGDKKAVKVLLCWPLQ